MLSPPFSPESEAGVLGSLLADPECAGEVFPVLGESDFFRADHAMIYRAIVGLAAAGKPFDPTTVAAEMGRSRTFREQPGEINAVLIGLYESNPLSWNAAAYAATVRDKAVKRDYIAACQESLKRAYADEGSAGELGDQVEALVFAVRDKRSSSRAVAMGIATTRAIERARQRQIGKENPGLPTGLTGYDNLTGGLQPGHLVVLAARPSIGKSGLALNIADHVGVNRKKSVLIISLEMTSDELADRALCGRSRVDGADFAAAGPLRPAQWDSLEWARDQYLNSKIFIDDAPDQSVARIAAMARRYKSREDIQLLVVDYLQLVEADEPPRSKSRHEVVGAMTRGLKNLGKSLGIPILLLAQLNREVEKREDKRPQLADLRECLTADTTIYDAQTGALRTVGDYAASGHNLVGYSIDDGTPGEPWKVHRTIGVSFWSTGVKPVFRLRTATGRVVRCSANHPFRTLSGWKPLAELGVGQRVAAPRVLPEPIAAGQSIGIHPDEARLLGYLICDGTYLKHRSVGYVKADPVLVAEVRRIALERFGIEAKNHDCPGPAEQIELTAPQRGPGGNPLIEWLKRLGIHGQYGHEKRIPLAILSAPNAIVADFLGVLWAGDGTVTRTKSGSWVLKFPSTSMNLLREVQMLLLRFGVISIMGNPTRNSKSTKDIATLSIGNAQQITRFHAQVRLPGIKGRRLDLAASECALLAENCHVDRLPLELGPMVAAAKTRARHSWASLGYRLQGKAMHRDRLAAVAERIGDSTLAAIAASEVIWDQIVSIEPDGEEEVFDVRVPSLHNFAAGGLFVHNSGSIEQDANVVLLLHRPEFYDRLNRPGEADLIIAKNRGGSTGVVNLAFHAPTTTFTDRGAAAGLHPEHDLAEAAPY